MCIFLVTLQFPLSRTSKIFCFKNVQNIKVFSCNLRKTPWRPFCVFFSSMLMLNNNYDHNDNAFFQSFIVIIECIPYTQVLPPSLDFLKKKHFVPCRMHILFPSPTIPKCLVNLCILHKSSSEWKWNTAFSSSSLHRGLIARASRVLSAYIMSYIRRKCLSWCT